MSTPFGDVAHGKLSELCDYWFEKFEANKTVLGLADVFYGDQRQIPRTPTLCLEPDMKRRELEGVPRRTLNTFSMYVLLYISKMDDVQVNARDALVLAEAVEDFLHADPTCHAPPAQPLLVHSYCTEVEPGYRTRQDTRFRACRIKFEGINKTVLGM